MKKIWQKTVVIWWKLWIYDTEKAWKWRPFYIFFLNCIWFLTQVKHWVPLMQQVLPTFPEYASSSSFYFDWGSCWLIFSFQCIVLVIWWKLWIYDTEKAWKWRPFYIFFLNCIYDIKILRKKLIICLSSFVCISQMVKFTVDYAVQKYVLSKYRWTELST
jgi:hypothetical protein